MPDSKISALPSATVPLAGTEVLPIVQSGTTDKVTAADLLRQNGQTVTTSNPVLSLAQTWNAGAVTFTGLRFNATDTASAAASLLLDLQVGGSSIFKVDKTGIVTAQSAVAGTVGWFQSSVVLGSLTGGDTILTRDAANTLALRNGTNAQTFRVYNTFTDASNYERADIGWTANAFIINAARAGTGQSRVIQFAINSTNVFNINVSGHTVWNTDNTYDIGASGAARPRSIYAGTSFVSGNAVVAAAAGSFQFLSRSIIQSPSDGVMTLQNNAASDFTRLQFGGTTSSFPAIARSGTGLIAQLADGSGRTTFECGVLGSNSTITATGAVTASNATAIPAGGNNGTGFKVSSTANFGVFFGSGAPTLSAAQGSLYLRSDGSSTSNRMYVNTDGSTTWTAVTTAA